MPSTTSNSTISVLKAIFARYGIPEVLRSDNGPQYQSQEFIAFSKAYNFIHVTSSPLYPQSNGQVERAVQTLKNLLTRTDDICQGLHAYWTTPMPWCNLSPSKLLMGQRLRSYYHWQIMYWSHSGLTFQNSVKLINNSKASKRKLLISAIVQERDLHCVMTVKCGSPLAESQWGGEWWHQQMLRGATLLEEDSPAVPNSSEELSEKSNRLLPPENADNNNPPSSSSGTDEPQSGCRVQTWSQTGTTIVPPKRYRS